VRIAAISDAHGNLPALDAVMADIAGQRVDVVNLGDLLSGAVQPRETADRLVELDLATVAGNHERQLMTSTRDRMGASDRLAPTRSRMPTGHGWPGYPARSSPPTTSATCWRPWTPAERDPPPRPRCSTAWDRRRRCRCSCAGAPTCNGGCSCRTGRV
jgi:hypothetical protein